MRPLILCTTLLLAACGASAEVVQPEGDPLDPRRLYPLVEGNVWTFDVDDGTGTPTFHYLRVDSAQGNTFRVVPPRGEGVVYELRPDGLFDVTNGSWVLKRPIEVGAEWVTRSGRTARVESTSGGAEVPAGTFEGCVVVSETGGEMRLDIRTTYCPDVGPVRIETTMALDTSPTPFSSVHELKAYDVVPPEP